MPSEQAPVTEAQLRQANKLEALARLG